MAVTGLMIRRITVLLLFLGITALSAAEFRMAQLFSDHMVLQRDKFVTVWGWANPGEWVTVEFAGQKVSTQCNNQGAWYAVLQPMAASSEPRKMLVYGSDQPVCKKQRWVEINDILVGEVWLGSGQSNMALTVNKCLNPEVEKANAKYPLIREFHEWSSTSSEARLDSTGKWTPCSPETVSSFSGALYFMARELHQKLGLPIGIINSSVGGTGIEYWMRTEAQMHDPAIRDNLIRAQNDFKNLNYEKHQTKYEEEMATWNSEVKKAEAEGKPLPPKPKDWFWIYSIYKTQGPPGGLFNGKIAPLIPYALRGIIWYQGEANCSPERSKLHGEHLKLLITDWRKLWSEELPFAFAQLPGYKSENGKWWPYVREGQLKALSLPKTGMITTVDIGENDDIHPRNKQAIGYRFAQWALGEVYGQKVPAITGPLPDHFDYGFKKVVISFKNSGGLKTTDGGKPKGFLIASKDGPYVPAETMIFEDKVIVSHPDIWWPAGVRYGWDEAPDCNLVNGAGLPASPFRTDGGN